MNISDNGVKFIAQFEGFRAKPYKDCVGIPTIGYGTTHYDDGKAVTMNDKPVSQEQALTYLKHYVENKVSHYLNTEFPDLTQTQFDALCSFCYNLGSHALATSTLKVDIHHNATSAIIKNDFLKWSNAGGHVVQGLLTRRGHEADLFNNGIYE